MSSPTYEPNGTDESPILLDYEESMDGDPTEDITKAEEDELLKEEPTKEKTVETPMEKLVKDRVWKIITLDQWSQETVKLIKEQFINKNSIYEGLPEITTLYRTLCTLLILKLLLSL
ncbi:Clr5 domain-containing protein [Caenorhabditis elegans]|nr:Clr5 domain-containing protein [Caenorhabditis elegans]CCD31028.1 Clr5 domain-containing protein [Caenorhabditis elegans]|eukprot:NP_001252157.1 Uncharacterized protein CELE_C01A2.1 [Caenorhabditis elegans]